MLELSGLYYPNRFGRLFLLAIENVLGKGGLDAAVSMAAIQTYEHRLPADDLECQFDFAYLAAINTGLEEMYGVRGGRGMALRIGRSWFASGLKDFGMLAGLAHPAFQALPQDQRAEMGLQALLATFAKHGDQRGTLTADSSSFQVTIPNSPMAWGRSSDKPLCHALVGMLQGCLHYASGGYEYHVYERECSAVAGSACIFVINRKPIGQSGG